jgi:hypothetical protein
VEPDDRTDAQKAFALKLQAKLDQIRAELVEVFGAEKAATMPPEGFLEYDDLAGPAGTHHPAR